MTIDSSAVLAIVFQESEAEQFASAIAAAPTRLMSAVNWLETLMIIEARYGAESADEALLILQSLNVQLVPFDQEQMIEAHTAWRRFGQGRHPAALNLGNCCAYATALTRAEPLLYKGQNFSKTDVTAAEW